GANSWHNPHKAAEKLLSEAANQRVTVIFEGSELIADMPLDIVQRYEAKGLKPSEVMRECIRQGRRALV
ncbi:MAG: hypothetical protein K2X09_05545, partial [Rickettsiales bacterium]|nr:hypothetical protein [Rickettsiales bacterium]